ncbi:MAG TPA: hypothetical protein VHY30_10345 [Verrucomicrobiae bacterium]|nr:hypothetical protein [Verrucomicrobiae bacterium]
MDGLAKLNPELREAIAGMSLKEIRELNLKLELDVFQLRTFLNPAGNSLSAPQQNPNEKTVVTEQINLCEIQAKALDQWSRERFRSAGNNDCVIEFATMFALLHPKQFDRWFDSIIKYENLEGLSQWQYILSRLVSLYKGKNLKIA